MAIYFCDANTLPSKLLMLIKMKKCSVLATILLIISFSVSANNIDKRRKQAQKLKNEGKYVLSENVYLSILKEDTTKDDVIAYLQLLLRNKNYTRAKLFIEQDYVKYSTDKTINIFSENIKKIDEYLFYDNDAIRLKYLKINTNSEDRVLTYYSNGILYAKSNNKKINYSKIFSFTNLDVNFQEAKPFKFIDEQNRKLATASFNASTRTLYYEANYSDRISKTKKGYQHSGIFYVKQDQYNNKWYDYSALSFNNSSYTYMQPSISNNGKRLYFVSDMPGGYGGLDIYYSDYENYAWSKPVNLGQEINTPFDDVYPFIFEDSVLYYSTEGRAGLGGFDIFEVNLNEKNKVSINIGAPYNSNADDYGIKKHPKLSYGFFNSNRVYNSKSNHNIYQFNFNKQPAKYIPIKVLDTINRTNVNNVKLTVYTDKTKDVSFYLLANGYTNELKFEANELYRLSTVAPGYGDHSELIRISKNQNDIKLFVNKVSEISNTNNSLIAIYCNATGQLTDFNSKRPLQGVKVMLVDIKDNRTIDSTITTENGKYYFKNLMPNSVYNITYSKISYESNGKYITTPPIDKIIIDPHVGNIITNFIMYEKVVASNELNIGTKTEKVIASKKAKISNPNQPVIQPVIQPIVDPIVETKIDTKAQPVAKPYNKTADESNIKNNNNTKTEKAQLSNKIYFKRNSYILDQQKKIELDNYIKILSEKPYAKVVIISHTDAFGDAEYNRKLSIKRANTIANYFIENGVDAKRVFAWGKGETQPIFYCDETVKCSAEQVRANRRTEIRIINKKK